MQQSFLFSNIRSNREIVFNSTIVGNDMMVELMTKKRLDETLFCL